MSDTVQEKLRRQIVVTVKGSPEWHVWATGLAEHLRTPLSIVVDHALIQYAAQVGYEPVAPQR